MNRRLFAALLFFGCGRGVLSLPQAAPRGPLDGAAPDAGQPEDARDCGVAVYQSVAFSPDRRQLFAGRTDDRVDVFSVETRALTWRLPAPLGATALAVSPDGALLAQGGRGQIRLVRLAGDTETIIDARVGSVSTLVFSPDGRFLLSGGEAQVDGDMFLWGLVPGAANRVYPDGRTGSFSSDGNLLLVSSDQSATLYGTDGHLILGLPGATGALAPDGQHIALASYQRLLTRTWSDAMIAWSSELPVARVVFSAGGDLLLGSNEVETLVLRASDGRVVTRAPVQRPVVGDFERPRIEDAIAPDGTVATVDREGRLLLLAPGSQAFVPVATCP